MATVTIRNLDAAVVERLKTQARHNNRSLEAELRHLLTQAAAAMPEADRAALAERIRAMSGTLRFGDSTALIRKGRAR